jgi:hypothetical protein
MSHTRAITEKPQYAVLVIPGYDPDWSGLLQHAEDGRTLLFDSRPAAFDFALQNLNDPWQIVEL